MKKNEPITRIMTKDVITVQVNDALLNVYELTRKNHIRPVPVLLDKQLVGIISKTDLDRLAFSDQITNEEDMDEAIFEMLSIKQVMSYKPRVIYDDYTVKQAAEILANEEFHALPVVDNKHTLVGIVTTTDVIKYLLAQY